MKKPHKHAAFIKAWADGAEIEYWNINGEEWLSAPFPKWDVTLQYRVKPEPKPDFIVDERVEIGNSPEAVFGIGTANIRFTFDGETGKLKKAEVIE